jgi:hypothetical protein
MEELCYLHLYEDVSLHTDVLLHVLFDTIYHHVVLYYKRSHIPYHLPLELFNLFTVIQFQHDFRGIRTNLRAFFILQYYQ